MRPAGAMVKSLCRGLSAGALLASAFGCTPLPVYQPPESLFPAKWPDSSPASGLRHATDIRWREFFHDARLQALIASALEHNRDLRMAMARVMEARAQYGVAQADRLPTANLTALKTATLIPAELAGVSNSYTSKRSEISLPTVSFELDFWGRVSKQSESARASMLAGEDARRALVISLISDVANYYFSILELNERVAITKTLIVTREKTRNLMRRAMDLGAVARSDVLLTEAALDSSLSELAILENQRASTEHLLAMVVGKLPNNLPPGEKLNEQDVRNDLAAGIPSDVLTARPDVLAAESRLKATQANIEAARAAFLPRILLTASLGLASKSLAGLFGSGAGNWSFQPSLSQPLFDGGRAQGNFDIAVARQDAAVADYEKTVQQAFREVADLLSARGSLADQRKATDATLRAHQERLIVAESRFKAGSISYLEVLDAQRDVYSAQQSAVQIRRAQLSTSAQLYKALGGGDTSSDVETIPSHKAG